MYNLNLLFFFFSLKKLRGPEGGPGRGPERGVQNGGSRFCLRPYFGHTQNYFQWKKPENSSLLRKENMKEMIINHKETRIVKDGED